MNAKAAERLTLVAHAEVIATMAFAFFCFMFAIRTHSKAARYSKALLTCWKEETDAALDSAAEKLDRAEASGVDPESMQKE